MLSSWFVSTTGNNNNPGSLSQPFATIQRAANIAEPGDVVYIEGGAYHETVVPAHSGTPGDPIVYEPYNEESVTIDGADPVTGWNDYRGAIYSAPQSWDLGEGNNQVFVDGQMVNEARWPNSSLNVNAPTWAYASGVQINSLAANGGLSSVTLYDSALTQPSGALVGALVHLEAGQEWVDQVGVVTASNPGSITVTYEQETTYQIPQAGNKFYVVGAFNTLNTAGEWYRDPNSGQLYLWDPSSDNPNQHTVEAKARQYGLDLSGLSYVDVVDLKLFACTINTDSSSSNIVLDHLSVQYASQSIGLTTDTEDPWGASNHPHTSGIILNGNNNILQNSSVDYSSGDGVFLGGSNNTVQSCIIENVDYEAGDEAGVTALGSNESILNNTIFNAGRSGVVLRNTTTSKILYNEIYDVGLQTTDLGGVYTYGTDGLGTEIAYNEIYGIHTGGYGAAGVYLDNGSQDYIVDHNVVWNCDFGLKMNPPCTNDLIVNNTFCGTQYGLESSGNEAMGGCLLINNIFTQAVMIGPGASHANNLYANVNPQFVNAAAGNFQLQASSPARNGGKVYAPYTNGYVGSAPDIGAYEYGMAPFQAGDAPAPVLVWANSPSPSTAADHSTSKPTKPAKTPTSSGSKTPTTSKPASSSGKSVANTPVPTSSGVVRSSQSHQASVGIINSGTGIEFTHLWAYAEYTNIDFAPGTKRMYAQFSNLPPGRQRIQLRIGSPSGQCVGMFTLMPPKKGGSTSEVATITVKDLVGVMDIYLILIDPAVGSPPVLGKFKFA